MATYEMQTSSGGEEFQAPDHAAALKYADRRWPGWREDSEALVYEVEHENRRQRPIWPNTGPGQWSSW